MAPAAGSSEAALETYRAKRDASRTPEPMGGATTRRRRRTPKGPRFVIQEHHARALHWDFRLERGGVLVSWAVPKGLPLDTATNHLAVHVEDHPIEYGTFEGKIPEGEYGAGEVSIWDEGSFEEEKWTDREVKVVLHGSHGRAEGRYVLFQTRGKNWMIHRMDPPPEGLEPLPESIAPMLATPGSLPRDDEAWAFEMKWDGIRAICRVDGGRTRFTSRNGNDLTAAFPELHPLGEVLGSRPALLDGEIVAFDDEGRPSFQALQGRMHTSDGNRARRAAAEHPAHYVVFDVLHLDGQSLLQESYEDRRHCLDELHLSGRTWTTSPSFPGPGSDVLAASKEQGLEGVVAKRCSSTYLPGKRSPDWVKVKNLRTQEVVVGGYTPGQGRRASSIGALLLGLPGTEGLRYVGKVGTGFDEAMLRELSRRLAALESAESPFGTAVPAAEARRATWSRPELVGEVAFGEWTKDGRLRHPSWRGIRDDKAPGEVVVES